MPRNCEDVHAAAALGFVGLFDCGNDLVRDGEAEVGAEERGFAFLERGAGQFGRSADDAFDFMDEPGVGFLQAGFKFFEYTHESARRADCGVRRGWAMTASAPAWWIKAMGPRAEVLDEGTQARRFLFKKRSKASCRVAQKPPTTRARPTWGRQGDREMARAKTGPARKRTLGRLSR